MRRQLNENYDPNANINGHSNHLSNCYSTSSTPNVQPLTDITNISRNTLPPPHVVSSILNSYQTPQVRRGRGRPRLGTQPSSFSNNTTVTQPRRRGRPPSRVDSPSVSRNVRQHTNHDVETIGTLPPRSNILANHNVTSGE